MGLGRFTMLKIKWGGAVGVGKALGCGCGCVVGSVVSFAYVLATDLSFRSMGFPCSLPAQRN